MGEAAPRAPPLHIKGKAHLILFPRHILKNHLLSGRAAGPGPALPRGGAAIFGTAPGARLNTIKVTATPQKLCRLSENKAKHHRLLLSDKVCSYSVLRDCKESLELLSEPKTLDQLEITLDVTCFCLQTSFILGEPAGRRDTGGPHRGLQGLTLTRDQAQQPRQQPGLPLPATMLCCGGKKVTIPALDSQVT